MLGKVLDWLLLLALCLANPEPLSLKPLCQPLVMAIITPLFYSPLDGILPHNPIGDALPKKILLPTMAVRSGHYGYSGSLK